MAEGYYPPNGHLDPLSQQQAYNLAVVKMPEDNRIMSDKTKSTKQFGHKGASPIVLQWLQDNYECQEGMSLPRSTLYNHYLHFCGTMSVEPINPASFGKLIRSVFPSLKTRRLGTRGHSKYHYYGVKLKDSSDLRLNPGMAEDDGSSSSEEGGEDYPRRVVESKPAKVAKRKMTDVHGHSDGSYMSQDSAMSPPTNSAATAGVAHIILPEFTVPETLLRHVSSRANHQEIVTFMSMYRQYCQALVDATHKHLFTDVEKNFRHFWQTVVQPYRSLLIIPEIVQLILEKDQLTYRTMTAVLLPNVLQVLFVSLPQSIRHFAKQLEPWLAATLDGLPAHFCVSKLVLIKRFGQSLHKQASLNHLTQAARAVLNNPTQIHQMLNDWLHLDFEFIKDQTQQVCGCGEELFLQSQEKFKRLLTERAGLDQWINWLNELVHKSLSKYNDSQEYSIYSQQFLLKWSYYSTMIVRDLTIRNASSFGSFHLLRTLFDEYVLYLIETKKMMGCDPISLSMPYGNFQDNSHESGIYSGHGGSMENYPPAPHDTRSIHDNDNYGNEYMSHNMGFYQGGGRGYSMVPAPPSGASQMNPLYMRHNIPTALLSSQQPGNIRHFPDPNSERK